jgi:hypothetical protein
MMQIGLIGLGAGATAALLFATVTSGSLLSLALFYIAPLPILIAALGWSHWAGLIAAIGAGATLAALFGSMFFLVFIAGTGLPAWWLAYLAMLARPAADGSLEWYPPGRLVLWAAVFAILVVALGVLNLGTDFETYRTTLHQSLARLIQFTDAGGRELSGENSRTLIDFLVLAIPPAGAVLTTITHVVNLWLAGKIVKFSGRLRRPWPDLTLLSLPRPAAVALLIAAVLIFAGGLVGVIAGVAASSLTIAYGILGFAILHAITRGMSGRPLILGVTYVSVGLLGWPVLALCLLGLADALTDIRARVAQRRGTRT